MRGRPGRVSVIRIFSIAVIYSKSNVICVKYMLRRISMRITNYSGIYLVVSILLLSTAAKANVAIEDVKATLFASSDIQASQGSLFIDFGNPGEFVLLSCVTEDPNNLNSFAEPTPGTWDTLDLGSCGGSSACISGIWGTFIDNPVFENVTCNWGPQSSFVFGAGSFRYSNVDPVDPIIDVQCLSGEGGNPVPYPSIVTEPGSHVAYILSYSLLQIPDTSPIATVTLDPLPGVYDALWFIFTLNTFTNVAAQGETLFFEEGGPTPPRSTVIGNMPRWRTCTIGLRMAQDVVISRNVPTLNELGLIAFAAVAGIAGLFFLRRRSVVD